MYEPGKMTNKEAAEVLKPIVRYTVFRSARGNGKDVNQRLIEAFNKAIEALENTPDK